MISYGRSCMLHAAAASAGTAPGTAVAPLDLAPSQFQFFVLKTWGILGHCFLLCAKGRNLHHLLGET